MSTPHDPGQDPDDGSTPQDPSDPPNPYAPPPPSPTTPIPPAPSPYGAPLPPPATPIPPAPTAPPPYGEPGYSQPGYSQPGYSQPGYGQPPVPGQPYPAGAAPAEPGRGMAVTSLVLAILGCACLTAIVAIPLAIVVLVRGRDGRNHGRGLAIAALVISVVWIIAEIIGSVALYDYAKDFKDVNDLKAGDCITAKGLTDKNAKSVTSIKSVACSDEHDGEILAIVNLTKDEADNYDTTPYAQICDPAIASAGKTGVITGNVTYTALTVADPKAGDHAACVAYHADGSKLTGALGS